jgi:cytochrome c oxidase subunit II
VPNGVLDGVQSMLNPQGHDAAIIAEITWVLVAGGAIVFAITMAFAAFAVFGRRSRTERWGGRALVVGGGIVFPTVTLAALLVYSLVRAADLHVARGDALRIEVTGEQWWWRVHYLEGERFDFATANEIRIPAGRPVDLVLRSADVIHSFWVPNLAGKLDMIPGKVNRMRIEARAPGTFRGQCAEYCGGPHGFMAFMVVAMPQAEFERWREAQRRPAVAGAGHAAAAGHFNEHCGACHTIRGTAATGARGPDLTHVGSRLTLGAARVPRNAGTFAGWIASNQHLKPGNLMPEFRHLDGQTLRGLAEYLEALE